MLNGIDVVLFDFDGTLVEIKIDFGQMREGVLALGLEYGIPHKPGLFVLETLKVIFYKLQEKDEEKAGEFRHRAEKLLLDIEIEAASQARMMPRADEVLRELRARNIKVGIVTRNCRPAVTKAAERQGLVFDILAARDDVEKVKPDPEHLLHALRLLGGKPENAVMIGDHPTDIIAGKGAGVKTIAVLTLKPREDFDEVGPDFIMDGVENLLEMM